MYINRNVRFVYNDEQRQAVDHKIELVMKHLKDLWVYLQNSPQCRFIPMALCSIDDCCEYHCISCELKAQMYELIKKCYDDCNIIIEEINK